ncbi:MAG: DsrE family protein [Methylocystaceae bacterium]|nr:DsrE family protein [Methylocystaceae bacterium]
MKAVYVFFSLALLALFTPPHAQAEEAAKAKTFVVITSDQMETQAMAMVLSLQAIQNGAEVRILLCDGGGDMALKNYTGTPLKPKNVTPQMLLKKAMKSGAHVDVCALYLPNRSLSEADLIEGVKSVKPPVIGTYMADPSVRYFTF